MKKFLQLILTLLVVTNSLSYLYSKERDSVNIVSTQNSTPIVYIIELKQEIDEPAYKKLVDAFEEARNKDAEYILLDINTYGGAVDAADNIRTLIIQEEIPTIAFINNQAASAGALISIACDSIYMRKGSSIGAATVVNSTGEVMPDKYQSFMRAMMRATAESHGKKRVVINGVESEQWHRDPSIAEKMVSKDSVLSFTQEEAFKNGYCEGFAESREEVIEILSKNNNKEFKAEEHNISLLKKILYILMSPYLQSLFLMLIIGGIYFELQSPGIGFPLVVAIVGALLYFSPLYLEGLANYFELILFIIGVGLLFAEIFILPGFGIAGISGTLCLLAALVLAMVDNDLVFTPSFNFMPLLRPLCTVIISTTIGLFASIFLASKLDKSSLFSKIALTTNLDSNNSGCISVDKEIYKDIIDKYVVASTDLFPSGKIEFNDKIYPAQMEYGYAKKGDILKVIKTQNGVLYCTKEK